MAHGNRVRRRAAVLVGVLALLVLALSVVTMEGGGAPAGAATPVPNAQTSRPSLAAHPQSGPIASENQKPGTTSWQSAELARGRGQSRREEGNGGDEGPPRGPAPLAVPAHAAASGTPAPPSGGPGGAAPPGAFASDTATYAQASTCGSDCWTDTVIRGYASATSVNKGGSISFYVSTAQPSYQLDVYRMGYYGGSGSTLLLSVPGLPGQNQPVPTPDPTTGLIAANWSVSYTLQTQTSWTSGVYLVKLTAASGDVGYATFVLRDDASTAQILYVVPVATYQAYNNWGGKSLYGFNSSGDPAVKASFDRPYTDWDGAGDFFDGEYNLVRWLEQNAFNVTYASSVDLEANPNLLAGHHIFVSPWHDEYWSSGMRSQVLSARDHGMHLAFFDANTMFWQIRWEASPVTGAADRVIVCYRSSLTDPLAGTQPALTTVEWRQWPPYQPENGILGGMYSSFYDDNVPNQPWVVTNASHWVFSGTGFSNGSSVAGLVGYEYDKVFDNGFTPANETVLSSSPTTDINGGPDVQNTTIYQACSGAYVFNAATISWAWKLDANSYQSHGVNAGIQKMTLNLLDGMLNTTATPLANCGPSPTPTPTPGKLGVYTDALVAPWADQSWSGVVNYGSTSPVHGGTAAISFQVKAAWGAWSVYDGALVNTGAYTTLRFWVRASQLGQSYVVGFEDKNNQLLPGVNLAGIGGPPSASQWKQYAVPVSTLNPNNVPIAGIYLQDGLGQAQPAVYLDDLGFDSTPVPTATPPPNTPGKLVVYDDHLVPGWGDASWGGVADYANPAPVHGGTAAIALTVTSAWGALYPYAMSGLDTTPYSELTLWAQASQSGQAYDVGLVDQSDALIKLVALANYGGALPVGSWRQYTIPLADLNGVAKTVKGFVVQDALGAAQPALYLDDIVFDKPPAPGTPTLTAPAEGATDVSLTPTISWTAPSGAVAGSTQYTAYVWDPAASAMTFQQTTTALAVSVPASAPLLGGHFYYMSVQACNGAACGPLARWEGFTTRSSLGAPGLTSPAEGATGVSLTPALQWTAASGAVGSTQYTGYVWDPAAGAMAFQQTVSGLSVTVPATQALLPQHFYYYSARACTGTDCGPLARWEGFSTLGPPGTPGLTSPVEGATGVSRTPTLAWTAPSGAVSGTTQYTAYVWDPSANAMAWQGTTTSLSLAVPAASPLLAGHFYYYSARACNGSLCGATARWEGFSTQSSLGTPGLLSPLEGSTGNGVTPTLRWSAASGAVASTTYTAYVWDPAASRMLVQQTGSGLSVAVPPSAGLVAGHFYYYSVQACTGQDCGPLARWEGFTS